MDITKISKFLIKNALCYSLSKNIYFTCLYIIHVYFVIVLYSIFICFPKRSLCLGIVGSIVPVHQWMLDVL